MSSGYSNRIKWFMDMFEKILVEENAYKLEKKNYINMQDREVQVRFFLCLDFFYFWISIEQEIEKSIAWNKQRVRRIKINENQDGIKVHEKLRKWKKNHQRFDDK